MPRNRVFAFLLLTILLAMLPFADVSVTHQDDISSNINDPISQTNLSHIDDIYTGTLDPVLIEHTGSSSGMTTSDSARTDVDPNPSSEVYLPVSAPDNYYSGEGDGGYYFVGSSGSADFSSPAGTISFWGKWDLTAPNGRFWGQDDNFETRWTSGEFILDFGGDQSLAGTKINWEIDHWYFFAITWNESSDYLAIFWGDESTEPIEDSSTTSWTSSVVGLHTENNILNSFSSTGAEVDGHVDDFRYYTSQRALADIQSDYYPASTITDSSLSTHYQFENDLTDSVGDLDLQVIGECSMSRDVPRCLHGWYGDQIKVTANDLRKLYALNGTFESGNPGTNEDWSGDGTFYADGWLAHRETLSPFGRQRASYVEDVDNYVLLENEGYYLGSYYRHYNGTRIYWYQNIDNSDQNEQFYFNLDYNYMRGPIGINFAGIFELRFEILDGPTQLWNWSVDLTNMIQRQTWFQTGQMLVNITGAPSSFVARVVLEVYTVASYVSISETDSDLDGDANNGQFLTVLLNNLKLCSAETLSCEEVELAVSSPETGNLGLSSPGVVLMNYTQWDFPIVPLIFSSNTSVVFDYSAEFSKMHRTFYSSATTNLDNVGAAYAIDLDTPVNFTFYTYVESSPEARDLGFIIYCPSDWENVSVEDPFGGAVLVDESDSIVVPSGEVDSVGWWKVNLAGPNYALSVATQILDESVWSEEDIFHTGEQIRCHVEIGTQTSIVSSVADLEMTWQLPTGDLWASEISGNASGSEVVGNAWTFGPLNATTGEWLVCVFWTNGTEIAFGSATYEIHHEFSMFAQNSHIDAQLDEVFTVAIYLYDQETFSPILSGADVIGNWSTSDIQFSPNLAKGWWEADANSSIVGTGIFSMIVNASMPFYSTTNFTITVEISTVTIMTVLGDQYIELDPDDSYEVTTRYMFLDGTGIEDANVSVLSFSGPQEGLLYDDSVQVPGEPGDYTIEFTVRLSGTYFVTLTASKTGYSAAATSFYVIVGAVPAEVDVYGSDLPEILYFNQTSTISIFYHTDDLYGIEDAIVNVTYNPASIVDWFEVDNGYYNISIRVPEVGSYSIYLRFSKFGFDFAEISFVFEVIEVPTSISFYGLNGVYYEGRIYDFAIYYNSSLENGVIGAELTSSASIRDFFDLSTSGAGWYNFTLTPLAGDWNATFWLAKLGFEEQGISFVLSSEMIPIALSPIHPLNSTYTRYTELVLTLTLLPLSGDTSSAILAAAISYILIDISGAGDTVISQGYFVESSGFYSADITVPEIGLYLLRISITKDHHEILTQDIVLNSIAHPESVFASYLRAGALGALALFVCIASIMIGRRFYTSTISKRNLELLELKGRLDDAKNLIGLLVIQRNVGLSVYSKIIKGGFQESLLSSFISAISHFREEFSMDSPKWTAIPITEVITAVQSEELICVIITVESASLKLRNQLETFSREVGGLYDYDENIVTPIYRTLSDDVVETFDNIFASYFDDALFNKYVGVKKDLPDRFKPVASAFKTMSIDHGVTPESIIKALSLLGFGERASHNLVLEAIDEDYLIASEKRLPPLVKSDDLL